MSQDRTPTVEHSCEEHMELVRREGTYSIHGTEVPVSEELYRCGVCNEEEYSFEQLQAVERQASRVYREQEEYLQPEEIRALRERWGLTQAQLEAALGIGRKTVARWEAGRVLQQRSLDNLLRAIDRFPQVLAFLAERKAVELPAAHTVAGAAGASIRLPLTLKTQLERTAATEGVELDTLVVMILAAGIERRSTNRELQRFSDKLNQIDVAVAQWSGPVQVEEAEPWLRQHRENQREYDRAVAS